MDASKLLWRTMADICPHSNVWIVPAEKITVILPDYVEHRSDTHAPMFQLLPYKQHLHLSQFNEIKYIHFVASTLVHILYLKWLDCLINKPRLRWGTLPDRVGCTKHILETETAISLSSGIAYLSIPVSFAFTSWSSAKRGNFNQICKKNSQRFSAVCNFFFCNFFQVKFIFKNMYALAILL